MADAALFDEIRSEFNKALPRLCVGLADPTDKMRPLKDILAKPPAEPSVYDVIRAVAKESGYSVATLQGSRRNAWRSRARTAGYWLAWKHCTSKTPGQIAQVFHRDRSTVVYGIERGNRWFEEDADFRALVQRAERHL